MKIEWLGQSCFRIQTKNKTIITDPYGEEVGFSLPPIPKADIATVSHQHFDHNNVHALPTTTTIIDKPGEFVIGNINITGIFSFHDENKGAERGLNTIYKIKSEGISVCHLGDQGTTLTCKQLEQIGSIHVLLIPVGGFYTINSSQAWEIVKQINPKIIIPMHFQTEELLVPHRLEEVSSFLKQAQISDHFEQYIEIKSEELSLIDQQVIVLTISRDI